MVALPRVPKTEEELKQIAKDLSDGKIFCDRHISPESGDLVRTIFMPLALMGAWKKEDAKAFVDAKPAFIYEYLDQALPRGINGYPFFGSMRWLDMDETKRMFHYYGKIIKIKQKADADIKAAIDEIKVGDEDNCLNCAIRKTCDVLNTGNLASLGNVKPKPIKCGRWEKESPRKASRPEFRPRMNDETDPDNPFNYTAEEWANRDKIKLNKPVKKIIKNKNKK